MLYIYINRSIVKHTNIVDYRRFSYPTHLAICALFSCSESLVALSGQSFKVVSRKIINNQWFHLAIVYRGPDKGIVLYINGQADGKSTVSSQNSETFKPSNGHIVLGRLWTTEDQKERDHYTNVYVDDLRMWNAALSSEQVKDVYDAV